MITKLNINYNRYKNTIFLLWKISYTYHIIAFYFSFQAQLHLALTTLKHLPYKNIPLQKMCKEVLKNSFVFWILPQTF